MATVSVTTMATVSATTMVPVSATTLAPTTAPAIPPISHVAADHTVSSMDKLYVHRGSLTH